MSAVLLRNPRIKKRFDHDSKQSEEVMQKIIDKAVFAFVGAMPLATINSSNIFLQVMGIHSNLTKDPMMHRILERVNELTAREL